MIIRPLLPHQVNAGCHLSDSAGWNQLPADWHRVVAAPPDCTVLGGWVDQRLAATASVTYHPPATPGSTGLAWIGMVLVDPDFRGQGLGSAIFDAVLEHARQLAGPNGVIGLDATDQGQPLYARRGFSVLEPIERWGGVLRPPGESLSAAKPPSPPGQPCPAECLPFDQEQTGLDRSTLLQSLAAAPEVHRWWCNQPGSRGHAWLRPGRLASHLGPAVAESPGALMRLVEAAARVLDGHPVVLDLCPDPSLTEPLLALGIQPQRHLTRMTLGSPAPKVPGTTCRLTPGFEWG